MSLYVGLDLGQRHDYTARAVVRQERSSPGAPASYIVGELARVRHESYETIADKMLALMVRPELTGATLVVDATGVGGAVVDILRGRRLWFRSVLITGGMAVTQHGDEYHVPKRELITTVQVLLQDGARRLTVSEGMPDTEVLTRELRDFRYKLSVAGHDTYGAWREGQHDDLVLAVAMACWMAEYDAKNRPYSVGILPPVAAPLRRPVSIFDAPEWAHDEDDRIDDRARRRR